jgi:hypothetical protein
VLANRCGSEAGIQYVGTSTVMIIGKGLVRAWCLLGRSQQKCLIVDTDTDPKWIWDWRKKMFLGVLEHRARVGLNEETSDLLL